jgi:hypothetical protein
MQEAAHALSHALRDLDHISRARLICLVESGQGPFDKRTARGVTLAVLNFTDDSRSVIA